MNDLKYFCYLLVLFVVTILIAAGLYAAWPTFTHTATSIITGVADIAGFFLILIKIMAGLATASLAIATVIWLYRFYLDTQVIRPGRHGAAQAIRWKGEIYELNIPTKARKQRPAIEGSVQITPDDAELHHLPAPIPTFTNLLQTGMIAQGAPLVIGVREDRTLRVGSWLDLYTLAVAGVAGTGKSTSVLFYLLQAVLQGARLVMIDPHAESKPDSLARRLSGLPPASFIGKIAVANQEILSRVRWTTNELKRRQKAGKGQPVILVVDEFTRLMRTKEIAEELGELLEAIAQEGRGYNIFGLLTGQVWTATRAGGTELRYSIASSLIHRIQEQQAELLIPRKYAKYCPELKTGEALLYDTNGQSEILSIPLTTIADVTNVSTLLTVSAGSSGGSSGGTSEGTSYQLQETRDELPLTQGLKQREVDTEPLEVPPLTHLDLQVLDCMSRGLSQNQIMGEVYGIANPGAAYQQKLPELRGVMQRIAQFTIAQQEKIGA